MKKTQASTTAQGIAFVRALESRKPAGERICYDPLARRLISPALGSPRSLGLIRGSKEE
jgi:O-methyltransferase involved in polyketide biosynthesis